MHLAAELRHSIDPAVAPGSQPPHCCHWDSLSLQAHSSCCFRRTSTLQLISLSEPPRTYGPRPYGPSDSRDNSSPFHSQGVLWSHPWKHTHLPCSQTTSHTCSKSSLSRTLLVPTHPLAHPHSHHKAAEPWSLPRGWHLLSFRFLQILYPGT